GTSKHEHDEADICAVSYGSACGVDVLSKGNERANNSAQIEDNPEPRNITTLLVLRGVAHHNGTLGGPQQTGTNTEESAGKDDEPIILVMVVRQEAGRIDAVPQPANGQGQSDAKHVRDGAGEEGDDGKGRVESRVGIILGRG